MVCVVITYFLSSTLDVDLDLNVDPFTNLVMSSFSECCSGYTIHFANFEYSCFCFGNVSSIAVLLHDYGDTVHFLYVPTVVKSCQ